MIVPSGIATRGFTIGIEDSGQVNLHISQVVCSDQLDDSLRGSLAVGGSQAHHSVGGSWKSGRPFLPIELTDGPFRVFTVDTAFGTDYGQRLPETQPHAPRFQVLLNGLQSVREFEPVDFVLSVIFTPAGISSENIKPHLCRDRNQLIHDFLVTVLKERLPGIEDPWR